jgi:hypothetical protein
MTTRVVVSASPEAMRRRNLRDDAGVSLVEVMVAGFIMTIALVTMASVASGSLRSVSSSQGRQEATTAVTRALETARSLSYTELAMRSGEYTDGVAFDWDGPTGSAAQEPVHATPEGTIRNGTFPYFETRNGYTLTTIVTRYQPERADGEVVTDTARRVTAIATLPSGGEVRQSTVVARAERGLPLPAFSITPLSAVRVTVPNATTGTVPEVCIAAQLRNQGANDRYEFVLPNPASHPSAFDYTIRVYLDRGTVGTKDAADVLLSDLTGNSVYMPDTVDPLPTNDTLDLLFCYQRNSYIAASPGERIDFPIRVQSLFDTDVHANLTHTIDLTDRLVLHPQFDPGDDPLPSKISHWPLASIPPTRTTYVTYDDKNTPGTMLERNKSDWYATFTTPLVPGATVGGTVTTSLWVASHDSTAVNRSASQRLIRFRYVLDVVSGNGTVVATTTHDTGDISHDGGGWLRRDVALNLPDRVVAPGDRLRLTVSCLDASTNRAHCHIMYDTVMTPAVVVVPLR